MEGHEEVFKTPLRFQLNIGCWLRDFKVSSCLFKHIQINCPITTTSPKLMKLVAYDISTIRFYKTNQYQNIVSKYWRYIYNY